MIYSEFQWFVEWLSMLSLLLGRREGGFLPQLMGKWPGAQHRVEGAARQRRTSGFAGPSVPAGHLRRAPVEENLSPPPTASHNLPPASSPLEARPGQVGGGGGTERSGCLG